MMLAYHSDPAVKAAIIKQLKAHTKADELVKGQYWSNGKGCAVGCTIHSDYHAEYERRFGIPEALARLEDAIFEGLPNGKAKAWPVRFMSAIKPGADLSLVSWKLCAFVVEEALSRPEAESVREACQPALLVVQAKARGEQVTASAARSAILSAESAAESAMWIAKSAAESAMWIAESAARSAMWIAKIAARSAAASTAWTARSAAASTEGGAAWVRYSDKLIELLEAA